MEFVAEHPCTTLLVYAFALSCYLARVYWTHRNEILVVNEQDLD